MSASAMMPIVFCASFVPCVNATKLPETICARRKTRFTLLGERRRMIQMIAIISAKAIANPSSGDRTPGLTTFSQIAAPVDDVEPDGRDRRSPRCRR